MDEELNNEIISKKGEIVGDLVVVRKQSEENGTIAAIMDIEEPEN